MRYKKSPIYVALIVAIIALVGFSSVIIKNNSIFVLYGDSIEQQYAFLLGFWQKAHDLDFSFFEWSNGLGANTFSYIFYNLLSPFNLIFLLFPKEMIQYLILYVDILKMMVLAIFSCIWLEKIFDDSKIAISGSLMITFSGWIFFYFHYNFLDAFIFYPLILYYAECFIQNKKKKGLVLSVAGLTIINYYFMYMLVPFLWLYALFRYMIYHKSLNWKSILADGGKFLLLSLLGMGVAGFILLPCLNFIISSPRLTTEGTLGVFVGKRDLFKIITSLITPVFSRIEPSNFIYQAELKYQGWGGGASLFTSIFTAVLLPCVLKINDKYKRNVLLIFIGIISVFLVCPLFYKLFQGSIDTRFFYMFTLLSVYCDCEVLKEKKYTEKKLVLFMIFATFILFLGALFVSSRFDFSSAEALYTQCKYQVLYFLILVVGCVVLYRKGIKSWMVLLCLEAILSTVIFVQYNAPIEKDFFQYESSSNEITESIKENDDGFYRVIEGSSEYSLANDAYINQVNGVSFYSSIYGYEQEQLLERLKSNWSMPNYDGKYRIYNLMGAKYWYTKSEDVNVPMGYEKVECEEYYINSNFIELGYVINQVISSETVFTLPYITQDRIMQEYLVIEDTDNTEYVLNDNFTQVVEWGWPNWLEVTFDEPLSDVIVYIENFGIPVVEVDIYENGEYVRTESFWQYHYVDLYFGEDEQIDRLVIRCEDVDGTGSNINVYVAKNASKTEHELYEKRVKESFKNVEFLGDIITAEITLSKEGYVFTQVPYDLGWQTYVDGNEVEIIKANGGFCALYLSEGFHEVRFEYQMPWMNEGAILSGISLGILLLWYFFEKRKIFNK